jgi:hypothetical protein
MILSFSGSQDGISPQQYDWANMTMRRIGMMELHHGGCVGADEEAHRIALDYFDGYVTEPDGLQVETITVHPASDVNPRKVSQLCLKPHPLVRVLAAKPALKRNRDIVNPADLLLATPSGYEKLRSGTWATIRYAIKMRVPVLICYPNGETEKK